MRKKIFAVLSLLWAKISGVLLWTPVFFIVFVLLGFAIFQIPKIQTDSINSAAKYISQNTSFSISVKRANLTWYDKILIDDILIVDHLSNDTLISIEEAKIDIAFWDFFINKEINAELLQLEAPSILVYKTNDSTDINISKFLKEIKILFKKENPSKKKPKIFINRVEINDGTFSFDDFRKEPLSYGKDYYHFKYENITSTFSSFTYVVDSFGIAIDRFKGEDPRNQLNINSLYGYYYYTPKQMALYEFSLTTDKSKIKDSMVFKYNTPTDFAHFNDSIEFIFRFEDSKIDGKEISLFNKSLSHYTGVFEVSGDLSGKVTQLIGENLNIRFGDNSIFKGSATFYGLPKVKETFMDIKAKGSKVKIADINRVINNPNLKKFRDLEKMDFDGQYTGFFSDFVAKGTFSSTSGRVITDINLKIDDNDIPNYSGHLGLVDYDLSQVFGEEAALGKVSMNGVIDGHGLQLQNAFFELNATIDSIAFQDYTYKNLITDGVFEQEYFEGNLSINDPNLSFDGQLKIDIRDKNDKFEVTASLDYVNLDKLGYSQKPLSISSGMDINMKGLNTEEIIGYINLYDSRIIYDNDSLAIDSLKMLSSKIEDLRLIHFETDGITGELVGNYELYSLQKSISNFYKELVLNIENDSEKINSYYASKPRDSTNAMDAQLDIRLWDLNSFVKPFVPNFQISKNIRLHADIYQDSSITVDVNTTIDSLQFLDFHLFGNEYDLSLSKNTNNQEVFSSLFYTCKRQTLFDKYDIENVFADINWNRNNIHVISNFDQTESGNEIELNTNFSFENDTLNVNFNPSRIFILDKAWAWNTKNLISYHDKVWDFSDLELFSDSESINIDGKYSINPMDYLTMGINNFELKNLMAFSDIDYQGVIDGEVKIKGTFDDPLIEGSLIARNVLVEEMPIGDIFGLSTWDNTKKRLDINLDVIKNNSKNVSLKGFIYPDQTRDQLDLSAKFDSFDLTFLQPFIKNNFEDLEGVAFGELSIKGNTKTPTITGKTQIKNGYGTVKYLKTSYNFDGDVLFSKNRITLDAIQLLDSEKNNATINGSIAHDNFKNFQLDLRGNFQNFLLLNTTAVDNSSYYGMAYGSGYVNFLGTLNDITITSETTTTRGTRIFVPLGDLEDYSSKQEEYIEFVNLKEDDQRNTLIDLNTISNKIKGITIDFDIEMTTDAYLELIFDVKAGDIIRGRGDGNIKLQINTDGDFNMFGDYIINKGGYNFTLYNIINKEFNINKGSSISWYGDPYKATLAIDAQYKQLASLSPILTPQVSDTYSNSTELRRKYTSIVNLNLTQKLLSPKIAFDIDIQDYPNSITLSGSDEDVDQEETLDLESIITAFKSRLESNEQEMNRQVLSLIVLRKFLIENEFNSAQTAGSIGSSLSEFVSNQLSYWATQVDENLEIDVDLASLDNDAYNTFQLRLSYTFLDGRLRITRGGALPNDDNRDNMTAIIGDWSVEYLLTPDGRLSVKMYSRTDQNNINVETGNNGLETGFSLQAVRNFNEFKELMGKSRKKEKEKKEQLNKDIMREEEEDLL